MIETNTRNATLQDLVALLEGRHARKLDVVVSAKKIRARDGHIVISGSEQALSPDGVTAVDGRYLPTAVMDDGISDKLDIPGPYLRRLRRTRIDLYDANINGLLHGKGTLVDGQPTVVYPADQRKFLLRLFRGDDGGVGVGRAFLSNSYAVIEDLDVLLSTLDAIRAAGVEIKILGADLSDKKMYVRVMAPAVQALAPRLLQNYRSPFSGAYGADNPTVFAGFEISNSEVGGGAFSIVPRLVIQVCSNGVQVTKDVVRQVHLGGKLDEGVIRWTEETRQKQLDLIKAKTKDAVTTFLDIDYMKGVIAGVDEKAGVEVSDPEATLKVVAKKLAFSEETQKGILSHFIKGGDTTAGGVLHAVTSYAQNVSDADSASDLEGVALQAMELAAVASR